MILQLQTELKCERTEHIFALIDVFVSFLYHFSIFFHHFFPFFHHFFFSLGSFSSPHNPSERKCLGLGLDIELW